MRDKHHDFVRFVGATNLGDDVERVEVVVVEPVVDIHLQSHGQLLLEGAHDPPVLFDREDDLRRLQRLFGIARTFAAP